MTRQLRTWIFLFLICFVALLWAVFMLNQGVLLWVSVLLVIVSAGIGLFAYFLHEDHLEGKSTVKEDSSV
jgi:disulfide bond formation protein DsbB